MLGFSTVKLSGSSMSPTFLAGDWLLVKKVGSNSHPLKVDTVCLIADPERPGIKLLKRVKQVRNEAGRCIYWLEGDNPASTDSRKWGWIAADAITEKLVFRYRKGPSDL
jgi:signal peptidase I